MTEAEALKSLGAFPVVQAAVAILVILAGLWMVFRGSREKKVSTNGNGVPSWSLYGPVHDVMGAVHDIAEQGRQQTELLRRIEAEAKGMIKEQREQTLLLEDIRNNQVQRGDITSSPRRKPI